MDPSLSSEYSNISKEDQLKGYHMMQLCRQFENACNQAYMQGKIRGFMHLDNGQASDRRRCFTDAAVAAIPTHCRSRWFV